MEFNFGKILLSHREHVVGIGKENVAPLTVKSHELVLAVLESLQSVIIVTFNPASFVKVNGIPPATCAILMKQAVLNDFKLELPDGAYDFAIIELVYKKLCDTLVHELFYTLVQLLGFHGVAILDLLEHFGRKTGKTPKVEVFALGQ